VGIFYIFVQVCSGLLGWSSARTKLIDPVILPLAGIFCYFIIMPAGSNTALAGARKWFQMPDGTLWITWLTITIYICARLCSELFFSITEDAPQHEDIGWAAFIRSRQNYERQKKYYNQPEHAHDYSNKKKSFHDHAPEGKPRFTEEDIHLRTLGLRRGASFKDIKKAYRKLAMTVHPDKAVAQGKSEADIQRAQVHMQEINDAYAWLEACA